MLPNLLDLLYSFGLLAASPWLLYRAIRFAKYRSGLKERLLGGVPARPGGGPCVWFHAVSVGEVLLLGGIVERLRQRHPAWQLVLSTTTNTGMEVARRRFPDLMLFYFPLDFSWAVGRAIARVRPQVVALAELELWPNFIAAAHQAGVRLALINGRMSPASFRRYRRMATFMRRLLPLIDQFGVQTEQYAGWFQQLGAPADRIQVTGSVKYDGIETDRQNRRTESLRRAFRIGSGELVWVAGSTSDPEERVVLEAYKRLWRRHAELRLILVPRHKERFDEVAELIVQSGLRLRRRSQCAEPGQEPGEVAWGATAGTCSSGPHVLLVDTLGELSAVWGLADIAFVGGSFARRGGQNMIEPAGYGAAILFGPHVWNFRETVDQLLQRGAAVQLADAAELGQRVEELIVDESLRHRLGQAARRFVLGQQGGVERTVAIVEKLMGLAGHCRRAA